MPEIFSPTFPRTMPLAWGEAGASPALSGRSFAAESPFAYFLEKAVDALGQVSATEQKANALIGQYVAGRADVSDVVMQLAKANMEVQMVVSAGTAMVNAWQQILQIQV